MSDKKQKKLDFYVRSWLLLAVLLTIITHTGADRPNGIFNVSSSSRTDN